NAVQVFFKDGTSTEQVSIDYPIGHRKRRGEGIPVLMAKFEAAIRAQLPASQADRLMALANDPAALDALSVPEFMSLYAAGTPSTRSWTWPGPACYGSVNAAFTAAALVWPGWRAERPSHFFCSYKFLYPDQGAEHEQETPLCRIAGRALRCAGCFRAGVRRPL